MKKRLIVFMISLPIVLSFLAIGLHFARTGHYILLILSMLLTLSLFIREPIIPRIIQAALVLTSVEWIRTLYFLASDRISEGQDWYRLAMIMGSTALVSLLSILLFSTKPLMEMYHLKTKKIPIDEKPSSNLNSSAKTNNEKEKSIPPSVELLKFQNIKMIVNGLSPLSFLLMDFSIGLGIVALICIGYANNYLRRKMNSCQGVFSFSQRKANFYKQVIPLAFLSIAIMLYFYLSLPIAMLQKISLVLVGGYMIIMSFFAYFDYLYESKNN